jgi:hypothetical protein
VAAEPASSLQLLSSCLNPPPASLIKELLMALFAGIDAYQIGCARISMMARSHELQCKA